MSTVNPIIQPFNKYANQIPKDAPKTAGTWFAISFTVTTIVTKSLKLGVLGGVLSATATMIDALIKPIMNNLLKEVHNPTVAYIINDVVVLSILTVLIAVSAPYTGVALSLDILSRIVIFGLVGALFSLERKPNKSEGYFFIPS